MTAEEIRQMQSNAANVEQVRSSGRTGNPEQDQYATGWWSRLTGGDVEKASAVAMAQVDRDFQERMSNTAYQRAMQDMKEAGLNPALMYKGAAPASTPSGSRAQRPGSSTGQMVGLIASAIFAGAKIATSAAKVGATTTKAAAAATAASSAHQVLDLDNVTYTDNQGLKRRASDNAIVGTKALEMYKLKKKIAAKWNK